MTDLSTAVERYTAMLADPELKFGEGRPYACLRSMLNDQALLASAYVGLTNREERQCLPCSEHEVIVEGEMPHQWTEPNNVVPWEHCRVCGIIRRRDDKNLPCKGPVRIGPRREEPTP